MNRRAKIWLWLAWVLATITGNVVVQLVFLVIGQMAGDDRGWVALGSYLIFPTWGALSHNDLLATIIMLGFAHALISAAQWLVLRRVLPNAAWWIAATVIGGAIGAPGMGIVMAWSVAVMGIAQCLVLRRYLPKANWWVPAVVLAHSIMGSNGIVYSSGAQSLFGIYLGAAAIRGGMLGAITGLALIGIVAQQNWPPIERVDRAARYAARSESWLGLMIGIVAGSALGAHIAARAISARVPGAWTSEGMGQVFTFAIAALEGGVVGAWLGWTVAKLYSPVVRAAVCAGALIVAELVSWLAVHARVGAAGSVFLPIGVGAITALLAAWLAGRDKQAVLG
jgi:hypothetical protein